MYAHSFLVTSVRGIGVEPTTFASCELGVIAFMNAAFGVRLAPDFLAVFFLAPDFADFLAPPFFAASFAVFFAAMLVSWECEQVLTQRETLYDGAQDIVPHGARN